jgi:positive regulator of sigma E activity
MMQDIYFPLLNRYASIMKPTVPETGLVIKTEGDTAVVFMRARESCRGCGAAAIGLCRASGLTATLAVKNTRHAVPGDTVTVALDKGVQRKGFLLAYGIPLFSFLAGSFCGHMLGGNLALPSLDIALGFFSLLASSAVSYRYLRILNASSTMMISKIIPATSRSEQRNKRP